MGNNKISVYAKRLRLVVLAFLALVMTVFAVVALGIDLGPAVQVRSHAPADGQRWAAVPLVPFLFALWRLAEMLARVAKGALFTPGVMSGLRGFAFWLMLSAMASIVVPVLVAASAVAGAGAGRVPIKLDIGDLLYLISAAVFFLVARMLGEAARIDAELREIV